MHATTKAQYGQINAKNKTNKQTKKTRTRIFTAELMTVTKKWEQPRCPSTDEYINKSGISIQ